MPLKFIALDISSCTGYAIFDDNNLIEYGSITVKIDKDEKFPFNYLYTAKTLSQLIINKITSHSIKDIIIEASPGRITRNSQTFLDWIQYPIISFIDNNNYTVNYMEIWKWHKLNGIKLTKDELKHNRKVREKKEKGRITAKHLSVRKVNEIFKMTFKLKDHNITDAILIGVAFLREKYGPNIKIYRRCI